MNIIYLFFVRNLLLKNLFKTRWKLRELIHGVKRIEKISHAPIYEMESSFVFIF
jgi:hypothetical protein